MGKDASCHRQATPAASQCHGHGTSHTCDSREPQVAPSTAAGDKASQRRRSSVPGSR